MTDNTQLTPRTQDPGELMQVPASIYPEEVMISAKTYAKEAVKAIREIQDAEVDQGFFRRLIIPGASDVTRGIQELKLKQVKAAGVYIDGLTGMIDTYIEAHAAQLDVRVKVALNATFAELRRGLFQATEATLASFWDTYAGHVLRVRENRVLTDDQKEKEVKKMYGRAEKAVDETEEAFDKFLVEIVKRVNAEIARERQRR